MKKPSTGTSWAAVSSVLSRSLGAYGMLLVLLLLAALFSILTVRPQQPTGGRAARELYRSGLSRLPAASPLVIFVRPGQEDAGFVTELRKLLKGRGLSAIDVVTGDPRDLREFLSDSGHSSGGITIATLDAYGSAVDAVRAELPGIGPSRVMTPPPYSWPIFLLPANLKNVASQITVIAIVAIGMTLVILTAGIDLSVGSLIALSAVAATGLIRSWGGETASTGVVFGASVLAMLLCGAFGAVSGFAITRFDVPPFIATLGMMQVASGLAYILSQGRPIYQVPENFIVLGRGVDPVLGIPLAVILMAVLFLAAHLLMSRTVIGRWIYAVGGNAEASRLAGVRVKQTLMLVYLVCGCLAGLGGIILASQLKSGAPTYGVMYELYVIAAVVVGGTSLSGGQGKVLGTLIGAFIIAVIQNGMNLTNVESYTQKIVLGFVILGAVLLDKIKRRPWGRSRLVSGH